MSSSLSAAVVDIGSNSIKILVAESGPDGRLHALYTRTIEARISAGIGGARPRLREEGIQRGLEAVRELVAEAASRVPGRMALVATSAVRDAENGAEFCARIRDAVGHPVQILTGDEEAELIGLGIACDPALEGRGDFFLFDLGGGSLECLAFRGRRAEQRTSLPLGCVRLTEMFVADPGQAVGPEAIAAIQDHAKKVLADSEFRFSLAPGAPAVGTGGTLVAARAIQAAERAVAFDASDPTLEVKALGALLERTASLALPERRKIPGLPPGRADVFPAALATLLTLADAGKFTGFVNSLYNLRWGVAAKLLAT